MVVIDGSGSATFATPLPVAQGGTGAATALGSGVPMLSPQTGSAPVYGCRAWGAMLSTGASSPTINASGNIASITRTAVGTFSVVFTTAMPDANYSVTGTCQQLGICVLANVSSPTGFTILTYNSSTQTYTDQNSGYYLAFQVIR